MPGKPSTMLFRTKLALNLVAQIVLVLVTTGAVAYLVSGYRKVMDQGRQFLERDHLVAQLQRSSDELTRMARLFVVSRDPQFADHYREVARMREGLQAEPEGYDEVYWDLALDQPRAAGRPAAAHSMQERMLEAGFDPDDYARLAEALRRSEALMKVEQQAMGRVDTRGSSHPLAEEDWKEALEMLHGPAYRHAKAEIMGPLRAVRQSLKAGHEAWMQPLQDNLRFAAWLAIVCLVLTAGNAVFMALRYDRSVRRPVELLRHWAKQVRKGQQQGQRISLGHSSEFGELSQAIDEMAESVERSLDELKEEVARRARAEQVVRHLANHDALTGLPSLRLLHDRLDRALAQAQRKNQGLALIFVDLNDFKPINDRYGHEAGDQVLKVVAQRLAASLREADTVGRIGGDEFLVLLPDVDSLAQAQQVKTKLVGLLEQPIFISVHNLAVRVSAAMGIAVYPSMASDAQGLMRIADQDMYRDKAEQKARSAPGA
ncbi:diguanylate cyclase [Mitsuaria sp. WAJ17]|uniref:GGDEF domain-containing protein n=1 Tax=Mitsuaria sp. WAJ17 TaxID=2761452 RepID=UPI0016040E25|nr:GGDEF domain-containing protein [Mitsuaria sp. WAJ17]MBB2488099.1 diguanylate cyclase [Mitsuaria sp. WAJ17]